MPPKKNLFLLLFFLWASLLSAQNPQMVWRNYTSEDGLPSNEVHYCLQTSDGYMWFATDNGTKSI
jgi:ligand-binding sensor domain-containing protein